MKSINRLFFLLIAVVVLVPSSVFGATMKAGNEVFVNTDGGTRDNLYTAGGTVSVSSPVFGDLLVAGGNIQMLGEVTQDIAVVGGSVNMVGNVGGDVRAVGGNISIAGNASGDLIVIGGSVIVSPNVTVGKDLVISGGQVSIYGNVLGKAEIAAGSVTINGHIKGNVKVLVDKKLIIGDGAVIDGDLEYTAKSSDALQLSGSAVVSGATTFKETGVTDKVKEKNFIFGIIGAFLLWKLISLIIIALVLVLLFRKFSNSIVTDAVKNPFQMLGKGFVVAVVTPIAVIILMATLFGAILGLLTLLLYGLLLLVSVIYTGVIVGGKMSQLIYKSEHISVTWKNVIAGILVLSLIRFIPFIGCILWTLVFLVTIGSVVNFAQKTLWAER